MKVLANDGISPSGIKLLEENGFEVITTKVAQEQVVTYIDKHEIDVLLVRSATKVTKDIIDNCASLKVIGKGGIGIVNIEVDYARSKGKNVITTPESYSQSVAELVFAHLFAGVRFLHDSNRNMPLEGDSNFNGLKKAYSNGIELRGKTLGIIGLGRIGKEVAQIALGLGMRVIAADKFVVNAEIQLKFYNGQFINVKIETQALEDVLKQADFITLHLPASEKSCLIAEAEFKLMKQNVGIINTSRGGIVNEVALLKALDEEKVLFAGLDVFEEEPTPAVQVLMHPKISLTPHIGASTVETQDRIDMELAEQIIDFLKS